MIGERFKYANVDRDTPARDLKDALLLLEQAGILNKICSASGHGLPFAASAREKKFKVNCLDIGLVQRSLALDVKIAMSEDLMLINSGGLAEQLVGQELRAYSDPFLGR